MRAALVLVALVGVQCGHAASITKHFCFTTPTLLPGGTGDCKNITAPSCAGGMAAVDAYRRDFARRGEPDLTIFAVDHVSAFVQMHRENWDVNYQFLRRGGYCAYTVESGVWTGRHAQLNDLLNHTCPPVTTNSEMAPESMWTASVRREFVDQTTGIGFIMLHQLYQAETKNVDWKVALQRAVQQLKRAVPPPKHYAVIEWNTFIAGAGNFRAAASQIQQASPVKIDVIISADGFVPAPDTATALLLNGTYVVTTNAQPWSRAGEPATTHVCANFVYDTDTSTITNYSSSRNDLLAVPTAMKDTRFWDDVRFAANLSDEAEVDDPIIGYVTAMPNQTDPNNAYARCQGGECHIGQLFTDSYIWKLPTADVSFQNSGGPRGPGWKAGSIKFSAMFEHMPYPNTLCNATLRGLTIYQMVNYSLSGSTISTRFDIANAVMQIGGMRVRYNKDLPPSPGRVLSIETHNKATGLYEPLQRTKLYVVAMANYDGFSNIPYSTYMAGKQYDGEIGVVNHADLAMQKVLADYIGAKSTATSPLNCDTDGRQIDVPGASTPMVWIDAQSSCVANTYYVKNLGSCLSCADGEESAPGSSACKPISRSTLIVSIVAPIVAALLIISVVIVVALRTAADARDTNNAPKTGSVCILFTDIQTSTNLWSAIPMSMNHALEMHHEIIRTVIKKHKAYEVKTVGDSFMIACSSAEAGAKIAMEIQTGIHAAMMPLAIDQCYAAKNEDELDNISDEPNVLKDGPERDTDPFNGLRIRIGVHVGEPEIKFDAIAKGYDYYGSMVNESARLEAFGQGGQICCSKAVMEAAGDIKGKDLGSFQLKGVANPTNIFEITPPGWEGKRKFEVKEQEHAAADDTPKPHGDDGPESDSVSVSGQSDNSTIQRLDGIVAHTSIFFKSLLRMLPETERTSITAKLMNAWHVRNDGSDVANENLCRRATIAAAKSLRRAERDNVQTIKPQPTVE